MCSSIVLAINEPLEDPHSIIKEVLKLFNDVFTAVFCVEVLIKVISQGLLFNHKNNKNAFLRNIWNLIDLFVVATSAVELFFNSS